MICGKTLKDKFSNDNKKIMTEVGNIDEYIRSHIMRCLGHVERMNQEKATTKATRLVLNGKIERPKIRQHDVQNDMRGLDRST